MQYRAEYEQSGHAVSVNKKEEDQKEWKNRKTETIEKKGRWSL